MYRGQDCGENKKHLTQDNLAKIKSALKQEQKKYNIFLAGGDTSYSSKLSITIAVIGYSEKKPILRSGAKNNDDIYFFLLVLCDFFALRFLLFFLLRLVLNFLFRRLFVFLPPR